MSKSRVLTTAALVGVLIAAGFAAGPALADDPPPVWTTVSGFPVTTVDGEVTVTVETTQVTTDDVGTLLALPLQRIDITNNSDHERRFDFGVDIVTEGVIEPLWEEETLGAYAGDYFGVTLAAGQSIVDTDAIVYHGLSSEIPGVPVYPSRTVVIYEFVDAPEPDEFTATEIARFHTPGEFVPVYFNGPTTPENTVPVGQELTVSGPTSASGDVELFPGMSAIASASGLPANRELELWLVPSLDYFYAMLLGGVLPDTAVPAGTVVTAPDGSLEDAFTVPAGAVYNTDYRLFAGDMETRYWPAGTYRSFIVTAPAFSGDDTAAPSEASASVPLGAMSVDFAFPEGTGGTWTAAVSTTGPVVNEFELAGDPPLYYHLDTTASLNGTEVEVCINYDPSNIPGDPPRLIHHAPVVDGAYRWVDITTSQSVGRVCGMTSSLSPFALARAVPVFSGFFAPVSMDEENIAQPGQAIPVKFSLGGDFGLDVVTSTRFVPEGTSTSFVGDPIDAVAVGGTGLSYNAGSDQYTYVWKTTKAMSLKTGRFELTLTDGTVHTFNVTFKK
jgi:hypothetical protein